MYDFIMSLSIIVNFVTILLCLHLIFACYIIMSLQLF